VKIGVKFCGHCNAHMDMKQLLDQLRVRLPREEFCYFSQEPDVDVLLIMHACPVECADVSGFSGRIVHVSPYGVNHWPVPHDRLLDETVRTLGLI